MHLNTASIATPSVPAALYTHPETGTRSCQLSLGELVELVASMVPEEAVADTVDALFERRLASFSRRPRADKRDALTRLFSDAVQQ
jgi:hypothetical protein